MPTKISGRSLLRAVIFGVTAAVCYLLLTFLLKIGSNSFTSQHEVEGFQRVVGLNERDTVRVAGKPWKLHANSADHAVNGYAKPKITSYAKAAVYQVRYGLVFVYYNEEDRVFAYEFCGG